MTASPSFASIDPRDGAVKAEVVGVDRGGAVEAVAKARQAQPAWAALPVAERSKALGRIHKRFLQNAEKFVELLTAENGKTAGEAWTSEVIANSDLFLYWMGNAAQFLKRERVPLNPINYPGKTAFIEYLPRGVVGIIAPWNLPVAIPLRGIIPALLAGNAVVFKPSSRCPQIGELIRDTFAPELPDGLLQVVIGRGDTGTAIIEAGIDFLAFTGSVPVGKQLGALCAERLIPCALELGGKDAAIVLADCDLERTAQGITWGAYFNAGQNCAGIERVYVEKSIADAFIARATSITKELRAGIDYGPMTTPQQRELVESQVATALEGGAVCEAGGERGKEEGFWYQPTLLTGVTHEMEIMREETFGPVLPVQVVADAEEAVRLANDSKYGLTASVWSKNTQWAMELGRRLEAGVVTINNHSFTGAVASLPWSGIKETGFGATNSHLAIGEMVRPRVLLIDKAKAKEMWWYPLNDALLEATRALRDMALGQTTALFRLLGAFSRRFK